MFLLVDGSNMAHRALHSMYSSNGYYAYIEAIPAFLKRLAASVNFHNQEACVLVAWDMGLPLHRRELYSEYKPDSMPIGDFDPRLKSKINMDPELSYRPAHGNQSFQQEYQRLVKILSEIIIPSANCLSVKVLNAEADDIIATFCHDVKGVEKQIISSDKDLFQLIDEETSAYTFSGSVDKGNLYDWDWVLDNFTFSDTFKEEYLLAKSIMGDTSDNIPKIDSVSDKTANAYSSQIISLMKAGLSFEETFAKLVKPPRATKKGYTNLIEGVDRVKCNMDLMDLYYPIRNNLEMTRKIRRALKDLTNFQPEYYENLEILESVEGLDYNKCYVSFDEIFLSNNTFDRKQYLNEIK